MIKFVSKMMDKLFVPLIVLNVAAVASMFYNRGKMDAIVELNAETKSEIENSED